MASGTSTCHSSPTLETQELHTKKLVEFMSCAVTSDITSVVPNPHLYGPKFAIPAPVSSTIASPSPPNTSTSVYTTPTTPSTASQFFPNIISTPATLNSQVTITTTVCSLTITTSTTSSLSNFTTIVNSTPNTSLSQLISNPNPVPNPLPIRKKKDNNNSQRKNKKSSSNQVSFDDISDLDQEPVPSTSRSLRQPPHNIMMDTFVSPPPPQTSPDSDSEFESKYIQNNPTLYPRVLVDNPNSDSELSPASQY